MLPPFVKLCETVCATVYCVLCTVLVSGSFKNFFPKGSKPSGSGSNTKRAAEKAGVHAEVSFVTAYGVDWGGGLCGLVSPVGQGATQSGQQQKQQVCLLKHHPHVALGFVCVCLGGGTMSGLVSGSGSRAQRAADKAAGAQR